MCTLLTAPLPRPAASLQPPSLTRSMQTLLKRGFSPTLRSVNLLLSFLLRAGKFQLLLHVSSQISSNSVRADPRTDTLVARALLRAGRFQEAETLITHGESSKLSHKKGLGDTIIQGVCVAGEDPEKGFALLQKCVESIGVRPSVRAFRSLVFSFSSRGKIDRAVEVVGMMTSEKVGYPVDNYVCSSIISGFCKVGKPKLALGFFEDARKDDNFVPNLVTYTAVVDALCRDGRVDGAADLMQSMEKDGVAADAVLYGCLAAGHIRNEDLEESLRKHKLMLECGIKPDVVSYAILADGFCKEGNVEKGVGFLNEMAKSELEPNLITYTTLIQGFCKRGKLKEAMMLLRKLEEFGVPIDEFAYSTLIHGLCRKGDLEEVFRMLEEMERKGIEIGTVTYNTVINGLCKMGNMSKVSELLGRFDGDIITYSILICRYLRERNAFGVAEARKRMEEAGICMDVVSCNILIKAYLLLGMLEDARLLFRKMTKMGLAANSSTYSMAVNGYCKLGTVDEARLTCRMLIKTKYKQYQGEGVLKLVCDSDELLPDLHSLICNEAIVFLCNKNHCEIAMELYVLARKKHLFITLKSYYVLLKNLFHNGSERLISLVMSSCIKEYGLFEPRVVNILSLLLCKKDVEKALQFLSQRNKKNISISVSTAIVDSLKRVGRIDDAYVFVMEAEGNEAAVDTVTYSIVVHGLCKEGYLEKALALCSTMRNRGVQPNIFTYNSVIYGLCQQGCLVEAFRVFDSLEANKLSPTVITYAILIHALSREGYLADAKQLFEKMICNGLIPNVRIYNFLIDGYCCFGLVEEAISLVLHLEKSSMQPDAFTISSVVHGFCIQGDMENALGFYMEYKNRGITLDFMGFFFLIEGLSAKGRLEEARTILQEMLHCQSVTEIINKAGVEVEGVSLVSLLGFLCEQGRIEDAISVLSEVGSCTITPGRFPGNHRRSALKRSYEAETSNTGNGVENSGSEGFCSSVLELSEKADERAELNHTMLETGNLNLGLQKGSGKDIRTDDVENLIGRSKFHDFDIYYPIIASLCSEGDLQKASRALKHVLMNSVGCS